MHKLQKILLISLIILLIGIISSCRTNKIVTESYVLPPVPERIEIEFPPQAKPDIETLEEYKKLLYDWQKWSTLTFQKQELTIDLLENWVLDTKRIINKEDKK